MQSLAHSRWECKYHGVFIPKYRRRATYGELRKLRGEMSHDRARQQEGRILEGHLLADPVPMCREMPPKHAGAAGIGFLKGKRALALARRAQEKERTCVGEHCRARGYAVATVGWELESVKKYIREQEQADKEGRC